MRRPLTPAEAGDALRRGAQVEQFVRLADGQVTYLTAARSGDGYAVRRHVVLDEGTPEFRDISEFSPVDDDEYIGEGVVVARFDDDMDAVAEAGNHGGSSSAWVNFGMVADDYWAAKAQQGQVPFSAPAIRACADERRRQPPSVAGFRSKGPEPERQSRDQAEPRLAVLTIDGWELRSAEASHESNPTTFAIPSADERRNLRRGQAVKLIFDQEGVEEDGRLSVQGERMYVLVAERVGGRYMGLLLSTPQVLQPDGVYLCAAAEVLFGPEHVIDIDQPPREFVDLMFSEPPKRTWPYVEPNG